MANAKTVQMENAFEACNLPENPDVEYIQELTVALRTEYYKDSK